MKRTFLTLGLTLLGCGTAVAERPIDSDSVSLTSAALVKGLASKDRAEQERARMYLLGVLDTTEGRAWCGYNVAKNGLAPGAGLRSSQEEPARLSSCNRS